MKDFPKIDDFSEEKTITTMEDDFSMPRSSLFWLLCFVSIVGLHCGFTLDHEFPELTTLFLLFRIDQNFVRKTILQLV